MDEQTNPIKTARISAGITQKQLADKLGVAQQVISRWETAVELPARSR